MKNNRYSKQTLGYSPLKKPIIRGMVLHFFDGRQVLSFRLERIFKG